MLLRLLPLSLLFAAGAIACINTPGTDLEGHASVSKLAHEVRHLQSALELSGPRDPRAASSKPPDTPAKRLEAQALDFIYAGNHAAALPLLQEAESTTPGDYSIAANLGTVHELVGDNPAALRWIAEGIRRNPYAHRGTEWVHVLVLEAKIKDAATPDAPRLPLIEIPARLTSDTPLSIGGSRRPAGEVRDAIFYQLIERMAFVKPKDRYVAELLFALAGLHANLVSVESSSTLLDLAETYGYSDTARLETLRGAIARAHLKSTLSSAAYWTAGLGAFAGFLVLAYRKKWLVLRRA